jgi:hypothetical protein
MASSTIVVKFHSDVTTKEIKTLLNEHNLVGIEVSDYLKRWTIEVPLGEEEKYLEILKKDILVEKVCSSILKGNKPKSKEESNGSQASFDNKKRPKTQKGQRM